jgi:hypothetical protein
MFPISYKYPLSLILGIIVSLTSTAQPGLLIHRILATPSGSGSNKKEVIELVATRSISFATEPYTIIAANGATATNGWISGGASSYAFAISSGSVTVGQYVYVGGTSAVITGTCNKYLVDPTVSVGAGSIGAISAVGVIASGSGNAGGVAVFNMAAASITNTTIPVDALFYGDAEGLAPQANFTVPVNDMYFGGSLAWPDNRYLAPLPASGAFIVPLAGSRFYPSSNRWGVGRRFTTNTTAINCATASIISLTGQLQVAASLSTINPYLNYQSGVNSSTSLTSETDGINYEGISGVISDPTDPAKNGTGVVYSVELSGVPVAAASYTVTATSGTTTVVPNANLVVTKSAGSFKLTINPIARGHTAITITVSTTSPALSETRYIRYAASVASSTPATTWWHTGTSDASGAVAQDDNNMIVVDDENDLLYVHSRYNSGLPLTTYNYNKNNVLALTDYDNSGGNEGRYYELDVEGIVRSPVTTSRLYFIGSMGNGSSAESKPNRDRLVAVSTSGIGSATTFSNVGYTILRNRLITWGDAIGYNFSASAAVGIDPKAINGFNIEGLTFAPDNTTLWIGFRAPLVPTSARTKAVICPITNFETWFNNGSPVGNPTFGSPIELSLGGRGIRDIVRRKYNGNYIIIAGDVAGVANGAVYLWSGSTANAPYLLPIVISSLNVEGVLEMTSGGVPQGDRIQLMSDLGGSTFYNSDEAKDLIFTNHKKFRTDVIVTNVLLPSAYINLTAKKNNQDVELKWRVSSSAAIRYFEVQASLNNKDFYTVATLSSSSNDLYYQFNTDFIDNKIVYYRVRSVENGGKLGLSNIASIRGSDEGFDIVPTLITKGSTSIKSLSSGLKTVTVYTSNGELYKSFTFTGSTYTVYTTGWSNGMYIMNVTEGNGKTHVKKVTVTGSK